MSKHCQACGKLMFDERLTHCSEKCVFENVENAESLSDIPVGFNIDSKPWV